MPSDSGESAGRLAGWLRTAARRDVVVRGVKVGAIVGTILVLINQGAALLAGDIDAAVIARIALTYLVPYCVSTYASVAASLRANDVTVTPGDR